jgi:hypothetical protein
MPGEYFLPALKSTLQAVQQLLRDFDHVFARWQARRPLKGVIHLISLDE